MGGRRRRRDNNNNIAANAGPCVPGACLHGGRCVRAREAGGAARGVCVCAAAYGGPRCAHYVGQDHACQALQCVPPAVCAWRPSLNPLDEGTPYCTCLEGARCTAPGARDVTAGADVTRGAGAWAGALLALAALLAAVLAALYLIHRRRHGAFVHARLADNVEISNPMYLAGEDEAEPARAHGNGGNHFANPVYDTMYAPQHQPEEQANLLAEAGGEGSPPMPERAALL